MLARFLCSLLWLSIHLVLGAGNDQSLARGSFMTVLNCSPLELGFEFCQQVGDTCNIYWSVNFDEQSISLGVQARTTGFVAVGFSRSGGMSDSDAVRFDALGDHQQL